MIFKAVRKAETKFRYPRSLMVWRIPFTSYTQVQVTLFYKKTSNGWLVLKKKCCHRAITNNQCLTQLIPKVIGQMCVCCVCSLSMWMCFHAQSACFGMCLLRAKNLTRQDSSSDLKYKNSIYNNCSARVSCW